jgi:hypothetical protein
MLINSTFSGFQYSNIPLFHCSLTGALNNYFGREPVLLPTLGGSVPIYIFTDVLNVPTIGVPIANHDNNQHQPDENLRIGICGMESKRSLRLF